MRQVIKHREIKLLKMIRRTDPVIPIYRERRFKTYQDALERISGFIAFYNDTRPHSSIGMKTPSEVHQEQGPQRIMWKTAEELSGAVCPLPQGTP